MAIYPEINKIKSTKEDIIKLLRKNFVNVDDDAPIATLAEKIQQIHPIIPNPRELKSLLSLGVYAAKKSYPVGTLMTMIVGSGDLQERYDARLVDYATYKKPNGKFVDAAVFQTVQASAGDYWKGQDDDSEYVEYPDSGVYHSLNEGWYKQYVDQKYLDTIEPVMIPYVGSNGVKEVESFMFIPSGVELQCSTAASVSLEKGTHPWEYYHNVIATATDATNTNRVYKGVTSAAAINTWLRTKSSTAGQQYIIGTGGATSSLSITSSAGYTPCFVIAGNEYIAVEPKAFKTAMMNGSAKYLYPVGTKIIDRTSFTTDNLIVVDYRVSINSADGLEYNSAVLMRETPISNSMSFTTSTANFTYAAGTLDNYLNNTYPSSASDDLKSIISSVKIGCVNYTSTGGYTDSTIDRTWFAPSSGEMGCKIGEQNYTQHQYDIEGPIFAFSKNKQNLVWQKGELYRHTRSSHFDGTASHHELMTTQATFAHGTTTQAATVQPCCVVLGQKLPPKVTVTGEIFLYQNHETPEFCGTEEPGNLYKDYPLAAPYSLLIDFDELPITVEGGDKSELRYYSNIMEITVYNYNDAVRVTGEPYGDIDFVIEVDAPSSAGGGKLAEIPAHMRICN